MAYNIAAIFGTFVLTAIVCAYIEWRNHASRANRQPCDMPKSRKHIRISHRTFDVKISYYDHGGRKITARVYPLARYAAAITSAQAKGYRFH